MYDLQDEEYAATCFSMPSRATYFNHPSYSMSLMLPPPPPPVILFFILHVAYAASSYDTILYTMSLMLPPPL